jgi:hypothetical protein
MNRQAMKGAMIKLTPSVILAGPKQWAVALILSAYDPGTLVVCELGFAFQHTHPARHRVRTLARVQCRA